MIVTINQPEHLPWLGFCHKAAQADVLVLLDVVQFRKNYFQNRNRILGRQGPTWITVPVRMKGHMTRTLRETEIHNAVPWPRKWWGSLVHSYASTPFFDRYAPALESLSTQPWHYLVDLNEAIIRVLFDALEIQCRLIRASVFPVSGVRSALLLDICRDLGSRIYLAGPHGRDYLEESLFTRAGIGVRYHSFTHPVYSQSGEKFVSNLSAVDLIFRYGPESAGVLRRGEGQP